VWAWHSRIGRQSVTSKAPSPLPSVLVITSRRLASRPCYQKSWVSSMATLHKNPIATAARVPRNSPSPMPSGRKSRMLRMMSSSPRSPHLTMHQGEVSATAQLAPAPAVA
jgi:hypothetical protein